VPEDKQLGGDRRIVSGEDGQPAEQMNCDQIQESQTHDRRSCPTLTLPAKRQVNKGLIEF
jgi:hypothetical protein